jgi:hypothetical protein
MKKNGYNSGYIGVDQLRSISGVMSQQKYYIMRRANIIRKAGKQLTSDGLRSNWDVTMIEDEFPESWTDSGPQNQPLTFVGGPQKITNDGDVYLDFDATSDGFTPTNSYSLTGANPGTIGFVIRTTDAQALFFGTGVYLGAFKSANKFYNSGFGTPNFWQDGYQKSNIYDHLRDGNWHYIEFKGVDRSATTGWEFSQYSSFQLNCDLRACISYDRVLSAAETLNNYDYYNNIGYLTA